MMWLLNSAVAVVVAFFASAPAAHAHTANISSSRIVPEGHGLYRVEVGFLGTDIERMFAENKPKSDEVDLTEPGVIEGMIGKFIQKRVDLQNAEGQTCTSTVVSVGDDPTNPYDSKVVLRMDCSAVQGSDFLQSVQTSRCAGTAGETSRQHRGKRR